VAGIRRQATHAAVQRLQLGHARYAAAADAEEAIEHAEAAAATASVNDPAGR
jgi:hypothetical protein